jgi:GTPase-associated protein 1
MTALEVHQTVHGYSDGHRLLAASRRLPRDAERALLVMTDISGPVTAGGFQSYLTGIPLPGTTAYAVARTWLADELNRPGCVWTHTLLVSREDLGQIPDLRALCALHRRPRKGGPWSSYGEPLALPLPPPEPAPAPAADWSERGAARTLAAIYGGPDQPAFLEADQSERLEGLVAALWSQAWPRLRGALRFCSWSLAPRALDGEPLDVQVVPTAVGRHLRHTGATGTLVTPIPRFGQEPDDATLPVWARAAAHDLVHAGGSLRAFLRDFGDELGPGRAAFATLVETHGAIQAVREGLADLSTLIAAIAARFPTPPAGRRLKAAVFGDGTPDQTRPLPGVGEAELLRVVATTPHHAALDTDMLAVRRRAGQLWGEEPEHALAVVALLAGAAPLSPLGAAFLAGVAGAVGLAEGRAIRKRSPEMFAALARRNPALAAALPGSPAPHASEPPVDPAVEMPAPGVPTSPPAELAVASLEAPPAAGGATGETLVAEPILPEPTLVAPSRPEPVRAEPQGTGPAGVEAAERPPAEPAGGDVGLAEPVLAPVVPEPVVGAPLPAELPPVEPIALAPLPVEPLDAEPIVLAPPPVEASLPLRPGPEARATEHEPETAAEALDRLDQAEAPEQAADLAARWRRILASHPGEVVQWIGRAQRPRPGTVAVAASVLDPRAPETRRIGPEAWLRAVAHAESQLDTPTHARLMAFLLALALAHRGPDGGPLAARAFAAVDQAVASGELPASAWQLLAPELPALPWWRESDRGERLRRGMIDRLVRDRWAPGVLLQATDDDEAFQRLVVICEWTREGQAVLKRLAGHIAQGRLEVTPAQRAVLARYS